MVEFNLDSFVLLIFILFFIGFGIYLLIKKAVKAAIRELDEEKRKENNT